jgi:hypothetical protein
MIHEVSGRKRLIHNLSFYLGNGVEKLEESRKLSVAIIHFKLEIIDQVVLEATLWICIREVQGSHLVWNISRHD